MGFLVKDIDSPEFRREAETSEDVILKQGKFDKFVREIDTVAALLGKDRGLDIMNARKKAAAKVLGASETKASREQEENRLSVYANMSSTKLKNASKANVIGFRDSLIRIGCFRTGTRSTELTTMTIEEANHPEERFNDNGEMHCVIMVAQYKNTKSGRPAVVTFFLRQDKIRYIFLEIFWCSVP